MRQVAARRRRWPSRSRQYGEPAHSADATQATEAVRRCGLVALVAIVAFVALGGKGDRQSRFGLKSRPIPRFDPNSRGTAARGGPRDALGLPQCCQRRNGCVNFMTLAMAAEEIANSRPRHSGLTGLP
jgi:hypothetical protein